MFLIFLLCARVPLRPCRLYEPFKALQQYADSIDLSTLDEATLHHVPYGTPDHALRSTCQLPQPAATRSLYSAHNIKTARLLLSGHVMLPQGGHATALASGGCSPQH